MQAHQPSWLGHVAPKVTGPGTKEQREVGGAALREAGDKRNDLLLRCRRCPLPWHFGHYEGRQSTEIDLRGHVDRHNGEDGQHRLRPSRDRARAASRDADLLPGYVPGTVQDTILIPDPTLTVLTVEHLGEAFRATEAYDDLLAQMRDLIQSSAEIERRFGQKYAAGSSESP